MFNMACCEPFRNQNVAYKNIADDSPFPIQYNKLILISPLTAPK